MAQSTPINMPKIRKEIRERHSSFIEKYSGAIQKVVADHRLLTDLIGTRLYHILLCFKEEGIVDEIEQDAEYPRRIVIRKIGFDNYITIITNGKKIRIEGYNIDGNDFRVDSNAQGINFYGVDDLEYEWENFSLELLDYIHKSIYDRKDALDAKVAGALGARQI